MDANDRSERLVAITAEAIDAATSRAALAEAA